MNVETLLNVEIEDKFEKLSDLEFATKEYASGVDNVAKLVDRAIEIDKFKAAQAQAEAQLKEARKDRFWKTVTDGVKVVLPIIATGVGVYFSFKFEENGTITSATGRQLHQKLIKF